MKEQPIIFSGEMVRAILDGCKTQTRRIVKPEPENIQSLGEGSNCFSITQKVGGIIWRPCPHGSLGDRLWVRETWKPDHSLSGGGIPRMGITFGDAVTFKEGNPDQTGPWKPSIFLPKWACRITLEITKVRVERLQEISGEDARAEGIKPSIQRSMEQFNLNSPQAYIQSFFDLWDSINGKGAWDANPWVWVLEFKKL